MLDRLTAPRADIAGISMAKPRLMGVLNVTPDSFSDGGRFLTAEHAVAHAKRWRPQAPIFWTSAANQRVPVPISCPPKTKSPALNP